MAFVYSVYLPVNDAELYTAVMLPEKYGKFPVILYRSPYQNAHEEKNEAEIEQEYLENFRESLNHGYAVVYQECRGTGKSTGDCIPYINERADGLHLQSWVREQPFYQGEIFLAGSSYLSSVHYATAPFAPDIKGACFQVQDTERYNVQYRNGCLKSGLIGGWYVSMYKKKSMKNKNFDDSSFSMLPLVNFSKTVFGEDEPNLDASIRSPHPDDAFWQTPAGSADARGVTDHARIPMLLTTAFYDIYTGGVFDMWRAMDQETKAQSALLVNPYDHGGQGGNQPIQFPNGTFQEAFGSIVLLWFDHIRKGIPLPFEKGKVTYYSLFENQWKTDDFAPGKKEITIPLGQGTQMYAYDPQNPPAFKGGLSVAFGGTAWQDPPYQRNDIITVYTPAFEKDTLLKGKMRAHLSVSSDCEDTCFYMRLSLEKKEGSYGLRDDITQLSNVTDDYVPGQEIGLDFTFDEHCFLVKKGEKLRVDIASANVASFVRHTNYKGPCWEQTKTRVAHNTVNLEKSMLMMHVEE